jgi:hypothetical protein
VGPENMAGKTNESASTEKANPWVKFSFKIDILIHQTPVCDPFQQLEDGY